VSIVGLLSRVVGVPDFATTIGAMIGLAVGIDYALFIVTRYRENLRGGADHLEAATSAMDTAGRAVLFAGMTVVVSLLGMLLIGLQFMSGLGVAASTTVAVTMGASVTLLPALLGFAGHRVEVTRWRGVIAAGLVAVALFGAGLSVEPLLVAAPLAIVVLAVGFAVAPLRRELPRRAHKTHHDTLAYRWSRIVQARPWRSLLLGTLLLGALAAPVAGLRLGFSDEGNFAPDTTTRRAYDLLAEGFGPGFNGPFVAVVDLGARPDPSVAAGLAEAIAGDPGVDRISPVFFDDPDAPSAALVRVIPRTAPQDEQTTRTVERLRDDVIAPAIAGTGATAHLTGGTAALIDFTGYLAERLVVFIAAVLIVSFLLLAMVFRSLLVPVKAVLMNVLSIAAAYGVVVAVFQWGWFGGLLGAEPAPVEPFVPIMMFAIVFGLSMDYEVFLLSRVREEFDRTGDAKGSVADGLAATAQVITAAAAIMIVVFGSFLLEDDRIIKMFGVGLAVAVLLDATLVRLLLVPATMELLGARNWWLPRWLDRILPRINVEGPAGYEVGHRPEGQWRGGVGDPDDEADVVGAGRDREAASVLK
jgi:RND superfamily putative drug exporter